LTVLGGFGGKGEREGPIIECSEVLESRIEEGEGGKFPKMSCKQYSTAQLELRECCSHSLVLCTSAMVHHLGSAISRAAIMQFLLSYLGDA